MTRIRAFHLPLDIADDSLEVITAAHGVEVVAPRLRPETIVAICDRLIEAQPTLAGLDTADIVRAVDTAVRRLRDPDEPAREEVLDSLCAVTGLSAPMAAHVLDRMSDDWLAPALDSLVADQFGGPAPLESFVRRYGRRVHAVAEPLGLHIVAGNVPGVGVTSVIRALLVRSATLAKSPSAEPTLTPVFARLLAEVDARLGACVAAVWWQGGDALLESAALTRVRLVVHYGGAESIASLAARVPAHVRVIEHGPRFSFVIIRPEGAAADAPAQLARAVAVFDQQGCVSPQVAWIIGDAAAARDFAARTADALRDLQRELPRGRIDAAEAAAIRDLRTRAEFRAIAGRAAEAWGGPDLDYTVVLSDEQHFEGSCLNRSLIVKPAASVDEVIDIVTPVGHLLQTVGIEGFTDDEVARIARRLGAVGATRIAPIHALPWPPPTWHHDGRGPLLELTRWIDLER